MTGTGEPHRAQALGVKVERPGQQPPPEPDSSPRIGKERLHVTTTIDRAKHRAPRRTPISGLAMAASSTTARRGALVAASSGIVLTMVATTASAAPESQELATPEVGATTLSDTALASLSLSPTVVVASDVDLALDGDVTAFSKPAPAPKPVVTTTARTTTSRSTTRTATAAATSTASSSVPASAFGSTIASIALRYIGVPYVYGGTTPSGFDCSGFTQYVFAKHGKSLPRVARDQAKSGTSVSFSHLKAGDLVFFSFAKNGVADHVGISVGNGEFINASSSKGVTIYTLGTYWKSVYLGARRV